MTLFHHLTPTNAPPDKFGITWPAGQLFPEPKVEISRDEFDSGCWHSGFMPTHFAYAGLFEKGYGQGPQWTCYIWWGHGTAHMMASQFTGSADQNQARLMHASPLAALIPRHDYPRNAYVVRYFRLGCDHAGMKKVTYGMHDHEQICEKCGYRFRYDSSG